MSMESSSLIVKVILNSNSSGFAWGTQTDSLLHIESNSGLSLRGVTQDKRGLLQVRVMCRMWCWWEEVTAMWRSSAVSG